MKASIISIGNELLQGRIVNTNATYISRKLTLLGFDVVLIASVSDHKDHIKKILDIAINVFSSNIVITTGGLGPTYDDITSEALSEFLNEEHVLNEEALKMIRSKYMQKGLELSNERIKMAYMAKSAKPIYNPVGTAPGILIKKDKLIIIALPGVPSEMDAIWNSYIEPELKKYTNIKIAETIIKIKNIPESTLAKIINKYGKIDRRIYIKSHPKGYELDKPVIDLYIMASDRDENTAKKLCVEICEKLAHEVRNINGEIDKDSRCVC